MTPRDTSEHAIRETHGLIQKYEELRRLSSDPKEQARAGHEIVRLHDVIHSAIEEYARLCHGTGSIPATDISEITLLYGIDLSQIAPAQPLDLESTAPPGNLFGVPSLPPHFLPRDDDLAALKHLLLAERAVENTTPRRVGVQGMGGIGKPVLATAVAHDAEIRRAFPDGIIWLTLGQNPTLMLWQAEVARHLGDAHAAYQHAQQGTAHLRTLLVQRACLLILDDVWQMEHATAFDALGPRCYLLITTRDAALVRGIGATPYDVAVL